MTESKEITMLPCPACNGEADYKEGDGRMFVECPSCGMRGPSLSLNWKNMPDVAAKESVIAQWNLLPRFSDIEQAEHERNWLAGILAEHCNNQHPGVYDADGSYCTMCKAKCQHPFTECEDVTPEMWLDKAKWLRGESCQKS